MSNKLLKLIFILLVSISMGACYAQEIIYQENAKKITSFSFIQVTGGTILIRATIDNYADSLNFVFDTGSGGISLDSTTVHQLQIPHQATDKTLRGIAGIRTVNFAYNHSLKLPGLTVDNLDFHINDYEVLSSAYGIKIDGVVGYSLLRRYIFKIDYDNLMMEVYSPGYLKYPRGGQTLYPDFSTLVLPLQELNIEDDKKVINSFIFDTGAGLSVLLNEAFVKDSSLLKKKKKMYTTLAEGLGGRKVMKTTVTKSVKLGNYKFRKVPVYIFDDEYNATAYPTTGGVIGNDILRRFNVILNYPEKNIYIKPNSHYFDLFDYSYTGLGIYFINNEVRILEVLKDSPADKAGFKVDDQIFAIDSNYNQNLQTFKMALQNANGKIKVLIIRNAQPLILYLDPINILTGR